MTMGALIAFSACDDEPETDPGEERVSVFRYTRDIARGERIVKSALETVTVDKKLVPDGVIESEPEAIGKFMLEPVCAGEFVIASKFSNTRPGSEGKDTSSADYLVVTDYVKLTQDVSDDLQKLIDENPGRTFYFPDGVYYLGKTLKTSSDPGKSVSFKLSSFAKISPASSWTGKITDPLIDFGGAGDSKTKPYNKVGNETYFIGGIISAQNKCSGITVSGTGTVLLQNFAIKDSHIGITINADNTDLDNIVITGTNTEDSIGVLVNSSYNTLNNMRIFRINTGIKLTEGKNVLRNLHPLYTGKFASSCGFWDVSEGNFYDICYSDHFATGFRLGNNTVSVLNGSFAYWYNNGYDKNGTNKISHTQHWGFATEGQFNSYIRNTRVDLNYDNCDSTFLNVAATGGNGLVVDPTCGGAKLNGRDDHKASWTPYLKTDIHQ